MSSPHAVALSPANSFHIFPLTSCNLKILETASILVSLSRGLTGDTTALVFSLFCFLLYEYQDCYKQSLVYMQFASPKRSNEEESKPKQVAQKMPINYSQEATKGKANPGVARAQQMYRRDQGSRTRVRHQAALT